MILEISAMNPLIKMMLLPVAALALFAGVSCVASGATIWLSITKHRTITKPWSAIGLFGATAVLNLLVIMSVIYLVRKPKEWRALGASRDLFIGVLTICWSLGVFMVVQGMLGH